MEHALDLGPGGGRPRDRGEEDPAIGVAHREREAGLEGLHGDLAMRAVADEPLVAGGKHKLRHQTPPGELAGDSTRALRVYQKGPAGPTTPLKFDSSGGHGQNWRES